MPFFAFAENVENQWEVVSEVEKYYETINYYNYQGDLELTMTNEVDEGSYQRRGVSPLNSSGTIETNYKKMVTTISSNGTYYRYKVVLEWKNMPKIRSYDVIGIGFYKSVVPKSNAFFLQEYCIDTFDCTSSSINTLAQISGGVSSVFELPSNSGLSSLKQTLYVDVKKMLLQLLQVKLLLGIIYMLLKRLIQ